MLVCIGSILIKYMYIIIIVCCGCVQAARYCSGICKKVMFFILSFFHATLVTTAISIAGVLDLIQTKRSRVQLQG